MSAAAAGDLAPGVPPDYYDSIHAVELEHWWHRGMRRISATLLGEHLTRPGQRLLDAGCGTGGFLRFAIDAGSPARAAGVDVGAAAIELARTRVPEAELHVAPVCDLPFGDDAFDVVVMNDVLQHIHEDDVRRSLLELRRVMAPGAVLLVRTNGARRLRRERDDWRAYDRRALAATLAGAGFACRRLTYVNVLPSLFALAQGRAPHAPSETRHGIATSAPSGLRGVVALRMLEAEDRYLARSQRGLPYGHTQLALATAQH